MCQQAGLSRIWINSVNTETDTDLILALSSSRQVNRKLSAAQPTFWFRKPAKYDAVNIHQLIAQCPPLDLNSVYAYLLLSEHFRHTCIVAGIEDQFVWQVAVHEQVRGHRLANQMLSNLLLRKELAVINFIETTVGPDNLASRQVFSRLAEQGGIRVIEAKAGSVIFFDCNTMHGSNSNISPWSRSNVFMVYNRVENTLEAPKYDLTLQTRAHRNQTQF